MAEEGQECPLWSLALADTGYFSVFPKLPNFLAL